MCGHVGHLLLVGSVEKFLNQLSCGVGCEGVFRLHGIIGGEEESGTGPVGIVAVVAVDIAIGVQAHDPGFISIYAGGAPRGNRPLPLFRLWDNVMVLAVLVKGQRCNAADVNAILLAAVDCCEVNGSAQNLLTVALSERVHVGAVEMLTQVTLGKIVVRAKSALNLLKHHEQGAILAVFKDEARLTVILYGCACLEIR